MKKDIKIVLTGSERFAKNIAACVFDDDVGPHPKELLLLLRQGLRGYPVGLQVRPSSPLSVDTTNTNKRKIIYYLPVITALGPQYIALCASSL